MTTETELSGAELDPPKVTGAPDQIWLCYGELMHDDTHENLQYTDVTWCHHQQEPSDVRYVRADLVEWQPGLSAAPRDGTPIDLWHKNGVRICEQWWDRMDECWAGNGFVDSDFTHWKPIAGPQT